MRVEIEITGVTPLICNKFTDAAAAASSNGTRSSAAGADRGTPLEVAQSKLYIGLNDKPTIPQPNLLRCLVEGGRFHKVGKAQLTTNKSSLLYACLDLDGTEYDIRNKEPWRVDTRAVRIPATGGRILCHRPMFDDWALRFTANVDTKIITVKLLRDVIDDAGARIGLGDFRPSTKGPFGKFKVTSWKEQKELSIAA
jgi:hypothetical protein